MVKGKIFDLTKQNYAMAHFHEWVSILINRYQSPTHCYSNCVIVLFLYVGMWFFTGGHIIVIGRHNDLRFLPF